MEYKYKKYKDKYLALKRQLGGDLDNFSKEDFDYIKKLCLELLWSTEKNKYIIDKISHNINIGKFYDNALKDINNLNDGNNVFEEYKTSIAKLADDILKPIEFILKSNYISTYQSTIMFKILTIFEKYTTFLEGLKVDNIDNLKKSVLIQYNFFVSPNIVSLIPFKKKKITMNNQIIDTSSIATFENKLSKMNEDIDKQKFYNYQKNTFSELINTIKILYNFVNCCNNDFQNKVNPKTDKSNSLENKYYILFTQTKLLLKEYISYINSNADYTFNEITVDDFTDSSKFKTLVKKIITSSYYLLVGYLNLLKKLQNVVNVNNIIIFDISADFKSQGDACQKDITNNCLKFYSLKFVFLQNIAITVNNNIYDEELLNFNNFVYLVNNNINNIFTNIEIVSKDNRFKLLKTCSANEKISKKFTISD